jgi:hypothetical protein
MLLNKRPWDNLETPDKIQFLTGRISEIHDYLLTTNEYKQQMELVIEIINDLSKNLATNNASVSEVEDVSGFEEVVHQPQAVISARTNPVKHNSRTKNVINNYMMHLHPL